MKMLPALAGALCLLFAASPTAARNYHGTVWDRLAQCESGGRWNYSRWNHGSRPYSGFDGGLQFAPSTWRSHKPRRYPSFAWQSPRWQQIIVARRVLRDQGWGAWPACSLKLGLR